MNTFTPAPKLRDDHLQRQALIYIRQSTLMQVRDNTGSTTRQYDLARRAQELGWPQQRITVIDQDQGRSGATRVGRDGFEHLIAEVGLGRAGAVFSLEASRLARSCSDWYRLLEICALSDTLVIDDTDVYDPGQYNDRLLLGFRGTMSEAELHWLRSRLIGGKLAKAERGELRFRPPTGYVFDPAKRLVFDPDEEIQHAVRLLFEQFTQRGTAMAVVRHFAQHKLRFPTRCWGGSAEGEVVWQPLSHARGLYILHDPFYAGVYVYGRTKTRSHPLPGETPRIKGHTRWLKRADWPIVLYDHHPAYLSWAQFLQNEQQLDDNRTLPDDARRGANREGAALLQGIALCGHCGRRMTIRYLKGNIPSYECNQLHKQLGGKTCQSTRGDAIDRAVAEALLAAMTPAQLEISMATFEALEAQAQQLDQQWRRRLERARYEAELARRYYMAVDPENRLVNRTLEQNWNEKLTAIEQLEREYADLPATQRPALGGAERERIMALAQDLPALWQAPTTSQTERKQLLRLLIKDVTISKQGRVIPIAIRWQTNACTRLEITRPKPSPIARRTAPEVIERIRALAPTRTEAQIAEQLNAEGFKPGASDVFTAGKVNWIRYAHRIVHGCPQAPGACPDGQRGDGRYSAKAAAEQLNVDVSTIADWCNAGRLDFVQTAPHGPRWILLTPEGIAELRKPHRQRKPRRSAR
ncbi:MAG: recombinase family protein [Rhodobacteraceae bacterium]|nr:recombinase family protein [Paracoccaceae bacterium]